MTETPNEAPVRPSASEVYPLYCAYVDELHADLDRVMPGMNTNFKGHKLTLEQFEKMWADMERRGIQHTWHSRFQRGCEAYIDDLSRKLREALNSLDEAHLGVVGASTDDAYLLYRNYISDLNIATADLAKWLAIRVMNRVDFAHWCGELQRDNPERLEYWLRKFRDGYAEVARQNREKLMACFTKQVTDDGKGS